MDGLRAKLQAGSHASFFHHDFHPDLLLEMHQLHETLFKVHLSIRKKEYYHLAYLIEEDNRHTHALKKHLVESKMSEEANFILRNIILLSEQLIAYLELLYDNQQWFEMELVDKEWELLFREDMERHKKMPETKSQYHNRLLEKQKEHPELTQAEEFPRPELKYKRYYLYPHPEY